MQKLQQWWLLLYTSVLVFATSAFLICWSSMSKSEPFANFEKKRTTTPNILWVKNEEQQRNWGAEYPYYDCKIEADESSPGHHLLTNVESPFEDFQLDFENGSDKDRTHFYRGTAVAVSISE